MKTTISTDYGQNHEYVTRAKGTLVSGSPGNSCYNSGRLDGIYVEKNTYGLGFIFSSLLERVPPALAELTIVQVMIEDTGTEHFPLEGSYRYGSTTATVDYYNPGSRNWKITVEARSLKSATKVYNMIRTGELAPKHEWKEVAD